MHEEQYVCPTEWHRVNAIELTVALLLGLTTRKRADVFEFERVHTYRTI